MEAVLSGEETRKIDEYTSRQGGIEAAWLMERAARALEAEILAWGFGGSPVLLLCGMGNNGGDGIALARMLLERGMQVRMVTVGSKERATTRWRLQRERLDDLNRNRSVSDKNHPGMTEYHIEGAFTETDRVAVKALLTGAELVVDAVFGVGLARPLAGAYAGLIGMVAAYLADAEGRGPKVLAVDMPSGISADTGAVLGTALPADITLTFGYRKRGQLLYPGAVYCGNVRVADIGFADFWRTFGRPGCVTGGRELLKELPPRSADTNKGSYGKLLVAAGSPGMAGAALLCAAAGYRTGCGLVYVLTPEENRVILQARLPEAVYMCSDQSIGREVFSGGFSAAVIGPGLSKAPQAERLLRLALEELSVPLVLDADALNLIAEKEELSEAVKRYAHGVILTPHRGEMARLLKTTIGELKADPVKAARELSEVFGCICVAKDARTVVYGKKQGGYICEAGNDGMATGGSGDVLAGIIGGLLAQRPSDPYTAAVLGVSIHAWAGDNAAERQGKRFMLAEDIIEGMREILK